ncbi:Hypothetical predicted protein [Lecanosticta acicola]|uniref:Uncharacterized protein n=1 Tax=Lecanosticta acicola TaxID=111012 RepID=A0AAI8YW92_9PEZI|nr:Hypothetical predicted protein [Lecanosticta acicola]
MATTHLPHSLLPKSHNTPHRLLILQFQTSHLTKSHLKLQLTLTQTTNWTITRIELHSKTSTYAALDLQEAITNFIRSSPDPQEKFIIYYGGCAFIEETDFQWRWHPTPDFWGSEAERVRYCEGHTARVDPAVALETLIHGTGDRDLLFIFHCPFETASTTFQHTLPRTPGRNIQLLLLPQQTSAPVPESGTCMRQTCMNPTLDTGKGWNHDLDDQGLEALRKCLEKRFQGELEEERKFSLQSLFYSLPGEGYRNAVLMSIMGEAKNFILTKGTVLEGKKMDEEEKEGVMMS